ncbi:MAG TPA: circumsporozoite protein [Allosphingosinicella sp.]|nr:circumsporozoite protein [Allosphingosinicella sp.]
MKKIALTLIAVSALGLAACNKSNPTTDAANNIAATANEAVGEMRDAANEVRSETANLGAAAHDQANQAIESTGNVADAAADAVANETTK